MTLASSLLLAVTVVAHDPGYYTSLARHIQRWLGDEKVAARVVTPREMKDALEDEKLAFLVGFDKPTAAEMATLKAYRASGGKLVVFHSSSPQLAALMDVKILGYASAPYAGAWSRMVFQSKTPVGLPTSIRQTSTVLLRAVPIAGKGRTLAIWADRTGTLTGDAAWIATAGGYWMTHVLLADGDEDLKAQMLGAFVGSVNPSAWSLSAHQARVKKKEGDLRARAIKETPRPGEIHAVWDHSGCGLYPGNWKRTMALLRNAHVTDLFVNVAGAGFAHYASDVLPRSKTYQQEGDQLAACLEAAKGTGIRVHAWVLAMSATRATPATLADYERRGWRLRTVKGGLTDYLDPANAEVRAFMLRAIDEIQAKYAVAGIHLDFVRWGDGTKKPANAAQYVTTFVSDARRRVRRPKWLTAAVYGKYPQCVSTVGQDWQGWLDANLVDYAVPMNYTSSPLKLAALLVQQTEKTSRARRLIVGIGVTANESRLDAGEVIDQIKASRRAGVAGNALFDLDVTLEKNILPYLRMGIW